MKATDFIAQFLEAKGVTHVFELSGGMITHLIDSISQNTSINIVSMHHEQSASFAADAYGRVKGIPGIALATSGPGATNLITGIASCYFDSSPAIFITGQVNRHEQKGIKKIRQLGFQETNIVQMVSEITKAAISINSIEDLEEAFVLAFKLSIEGRPGPVLIDIPMDVQRADYEFFKQINPENLEKHENIDLNQSIEALTIEIINSSKPLILAGRGVAASFTYDQLSLFSQITHIPIVTTLLGIDLVEYSDPNRVGFIGSYGNRWANIAIGECDLLIVLGSRLDIRQTGADTSFFAKRKIFHVDCDLNEINNRIKGCIPINTDLKLFLKAFNSFNHHIKFEKKISWYSQLEDLKLKNLDTDELKDCKGINPNIFIEYLSELSTSSACFLADVGSHQMWTAQSIRLRKAQKFITSGGMGAMGFALPGAIGACFAFNKLPVVTIIGDGSMQINIQELQTIVRNNLPIKIIVLNNNSLGMIRQFQDSYFNSRYQSTFLGYSAPDFQKISTAYGIDSMTIENPSEIKNGIEWLWSIENHLKPQLLQVIIDPYTNTYPKIAFGRPITEMEPYCKPIEIEGT